MPTPPLSDATLREAARAYLENNCVAINAADALGINRATFQKRIEKAKAKGFLLSPGAMGQVERANLNPTEAKGGWIHQYDDEGKKVGTTRWAATEIEQEALFDRIRAAVNGIDAAHNVSPPVDVAKDLLTVYPFADVHFGSLSWGHETGEDYDTKIAAARIKSMMHRAIDEGPPSETAVIIGVGDQFNSNDNSNMTPQSKHVQDNDTRFFHTLDLGIDAFGAVIEFALTRHKRVIVRFLRGNHDPEAYLFLMFALAERYRDNPRVEVQKDPREFFKHVFGRNLIAAAHGDKAKAEAIALMMATQYPEDWAATRHRVLFTGHLHSYKEVEVAGMRHIQLGPIASRNAWAASRAFLSEIEFRPITYHRETGERFRGRVPA
jgi:hypothetical protein